LVEVEEGDQDVDSKMALGKDAGLCYAWVKELHMLCGQEGLDKLVGSLCTPQTV